jgi:hypothetical protein
MPKIDLNLIASSPVQDLKTKSSDRFRQAPCMENNMESSTNQRNVIHPHDHGKKIDPSEVVK